MPTRWSEQHAGPGFPGSPDLESWAPEGRLTGGGLRGFRRWLVAAGIVALISGIVAVAVPVLASVATAIFIGWVLVVAGVAMTVRTVSHRSLIRGLEALVTLIAGLYVLLFPLSGTVTLTFVLAVWFFASGVLLLIDALSSRAGAASWAAAFGGVLSIILGFLVAASVPSSAPWALGLLVGIDLIFWGVRALTAAWLLNDIS
ncbi:MAG TPA: DUF308 domain-containing protein [Solirubrobacteraceae bacterium]|jgi:uncharacterized membrane protein HdeD (DUF308 family)